MKEIQSLQNNIIKETLKLKDKKQRIASKQFLVEGYHLVEEAYKHRLLTAVFSANSSDFKKYQIENQYLVSDAIIKKLSSTINPQGIIGVVNSPKFNEIDLDSESLKLVLLDGINDPGNLGSIIRTAAALGYDGIYMSLDTVDVYNDKSIRATQGAVFKIPFFYEDLTKVVSKLKKHCITCYGTILDKAKDLEEIKPGKKYAVSFGNEARGMSEKLMQQMDQNIKINMSNEVESLNVLSASSIVLYVLPKKVI